MSDDPRSESAETAPVDDLLGEGGEELGQAEPNQTQAVIRNSAFMAVGTVISRITGVARDIAIAAALGFAILADTYALGNSLPNIIYILIVGGALNAVFIPQLVRHMRTDDDGGNGYADRLITAVGSVLLLVTVVAVVAAPWIVSLYATDQFTTEQLDLAVAFARFCLPQIVFYGLYTMFSQVLNSRMRFAAPMFAPIVNNIVVIGTALAFIYLVGTSVTDTTITSTEVMWLGIGTTLGVVAQALVLIPVLSRAGYRWRPRFDLRGHGLGHAGSLATWTIGLVLVNQVGFLIIARLATDANVLAAASDGVAQGLATYQRAFLVFMLPHSVITISLVTALFPRMSRAAANGDLSQVADDVGQGIRLTSALIVPGSIFVLIVGPAIGTVLFGYGQGAGEAATYTGAVVSVFAVGMLPFAFFYTLLRGWYAIEDTRTPFFVTVIYNLLAIPLTIALFYAVPGDMKVMALALGYGLAYWIVFGIAWVWLARRLGGLRLRTTAIAVARMVCAAVLAAAVTVAVGCMVGWATGLTPSQTYERFSTEHVWGIAGLIGGALVMLGTYILTCRLLQVSETREVIRSLTGRTVKSPGAA